MNKAIKKCCVCGNNETGEFIIINNIKYHLLCIEKMQQENQQLKQQNGFLMKQDNILQTLMQWLYEEVCVEKSSSSFKQPLIIVIDKIKELKEEMK